MNTIKITLLIIIVLFFNVKCIHHPNIVRRTMQEERVQLSQSHMQFTFDLLSNLVMSYGYNKKTHQLQSFVFSPLSIESLLLMIHLGSKGQTNTQLTKLLHFDSIKSNTSRMHTIYGESIASLLDDQEVAKYLSIANQLFVNQGLKTRASYEIALKRIHGATLKSVDFSSPNLLEV